jgi:hypothetical protein
MGVGGLMIGTTLAAHFGIDPNAAISTQANGGKYFLALLCVLLLLLVAGAVVACGVVALALIGLKGPHTARDVMSGRHYPTDWVA